MKMVDQVLQVQIMFLVVTIVATTQKSLKVLLATLVSLDEMDCLVIRGIMGCPVKIISQKVLGDDLVVQVMLGPMDSVDLLIFMVFSRFSTLRLRLFQCQ